MRNLPRRYMLHLFSFIKHSASGEISQPKLLGRFGKHLINCNSGFANTCMRTLLRSLPLPIYSSWGGISWTLSNKFLSNFPKKSEIRVAKVADRSGCLQDISPCLSSLVDTVSRPAVIWTREVCVQRKQCLWHPNIYNFLEFLPAI